MTYRIFLSITVLVVFSAKSNAQNSERVLSELKSCLQSDGENCGADISIALARFQKEKNVKEYFEMSFGAGRIFLDLGFPKKSVNFFHKSHKTALALRNDTLIEKSQAHIGRAHLFMGAMDSAKFYYTKSLDLSKEIGDEILIGNALLRLGQVENYLGNSTVALEEIMEAVGILEKSGAPQDLGAAYYTLGGYYGWQNKDSLSTFYLRKSVQFYAKSTDSVRFGYALTNYSNTSLNIGFTDTAILYLPKALAIFRGKDARAEMNAEAQLGKAYFFRDNPQEGLRHLRISNRLARKGEVVDQLAFNNQIMSAIFRDLKQYDSAVVVLKKAIDFHKQTGSVMGLHNALSSAHHLFRDMGDFKQAYSWATDFYDFKDSLYTLENEKNIAELQEKYESEKKEAEIQLQKQEIELLNSESRAKTIRNIALGIGLFLTLLIAILIVNRQRTKMRLNRKISQEKEAAQRAIILQKEAEAKNLTAELDHKKRELTSRALAIAEKNELLSELKSQMNELSEEMEERATILQMARKIENAETKTADWDNFIEIFNDVHPSFLDNLKRNHPELTANDLRLLALMRMNFSNKEMASILHISDAGLKKARYRLRKKVDLNSEDSFENFVMEHA